MKKRIAVCLSGQARTWKFCFNNITNFLKHKDYEFDFFIHTWENNLYSPSVNLNYVYDTDVKEYISSYKPKLFKIQDENKFNKRIAGKLKHRDYINSLYSIYSFKQSIVLKQIYERNNNFKYDYVIKLRPDVFFVNRTFDEHMSFLENEEKSFLTYFSYNDDWKTNLNNTWAADLYWIFSSSDDADLFATHFKKKIEYEKNNDDIYTQYRHTALNEFKPINLQEKLEDSKYFLMYIHRPYHISFINDLDKTFDKSIHKKMQYFDAVFRKIGIDDAFRGVRVFQDILKEYSKEEFNSMSVVELLQQNKFIKDIILINLEKYL